MPPSSQGQSVPRVWGKRGARPRAPRDRRYGSAYLFGAICSERRTGAAIIMPEVNIGAMNEHLAEISRSDRRAGAGWRRLAPLQVPDNIALLPLPPYSPELKPLENRKSLISYGIVVAGLGPAI